MTSYTHLLSSLTLDEKLSMLTGATSWATVAVDRLGIPAIKMADGPHGLRTEYTDKDGKTKSHEATCFPTSSCMASTWNVDLVQQVGQALGLQCAVTGVDLLLGPGTNMKRTPLCGRNFEYFSEDPHLAAQCCIAYIRGVQSQGVGACIKHFAGNEQEYDRPHVSSEIDERALREIYLKPFEDAIKTTQPWSVMCAYNRINGIWCSENPKLLGTILRDEWGFAGFVVSDWGAVHDCVRAVRAPLELEMPSNPKSAPLLKAAIAEGKLTEKEVDRCVESLLKTVAKAVDARPGRAKEYSRDEHHKLARDVAAEGIVLLKNDGVLPLRDEKSTNRVKKIAVIGEFAKSPVLQGGGSAGVWSNMIEKPLDAIQKFAGEGLEVNFAAAYLAWEGMTPTAVDALGEALEVARQADVVLLFVANTNKIEAESFDRWDLKLSFAQESVIQRMAKVNPNLVVVVQAGSAVDMSNWIDKTRAVVWQGYAGEAVGPALADILFGVVNPSGKLAETFPQRIQDNSAYPYYPGDGFITWYGDSILMGYRHYDARGLEVAFPFGFGLSYTTFEYRSLTVDKPQINENETVTVRVMVENTGSRTGKEVVQLYVTDTLRRVLRPDRELKAFAKVELKPGQKKEVVFTLDRQAFAYWNTSLSKWHVETGAFLLQAGSSSRELKVKGEVRVKGEIEFT